MEAMAHSQSKPDAFLVVFEQHYETVGSMWPDPLEWSGRPGSGVAPRDLGASSRTGSTFGTPFIHEGS